MNTSGATNRKPKSGGGKSPKPPTKPGRLNTRQELFAELVASGTPATVAYRKAGYSDKGRNAEGNACRMMENDGVAERIAALKAQTAAKAEFKRDDLVRILAAAIQTPIGEIDERNPLAQEYTEDAIAGGSRGTLKRGQVASGNETVEPVVIRRRVKCIGKIEAARLLCEIMGWKSPDQLVVDDGPKRLESIAERAANVVSALSRIGRKTTVQTTTRSGLSRVPRDITGDAS